MINKDQSIDVSRKKFYNTHNHLGIIEIPINELEYFDENYAGVKIGVYNAMIKTCNLCNTYNEAENK